MWPDGIVLQAPLFDKYLGFFECVHTSQYTSNSQVARSSRAGRAKINVLSGGWGCNPNRLFLWGTFMAVMSEDNEGYAPVTGVHSNLS